VVRVPRWSTYYFTFPCGEKEELSLYIITHNAMKVMWGVELELPLFLNSAPDRGERSPSRLAPLYSRETYSRHPLGVKLNGSKNRSVSCAQYKCFFLSGIEPRLNGRKRGRLVTAVAGLSSNHIKVVKCIVTLSTS
jgi:hypothetical protein